MDITSAIARIQARIDQIWGTGDSDVAAEQLAPAASPRGGAFASMVKSAMQPGEAAQIPPEQIESLVQSNAAESQVDPALIRAVMANESGFNPNATSNAGAQGLMQLMPQTASMLGVTNAYDPQQNVRGGARYLRSLLDRFGGDLTKAIAAYNAGPEAVEQHNGVPPFPETQNYVKSVLDSYQQYKGQR
jgi:soluble lytic murein transglycosylase-like protein